MKKTIKIILYSIFLSIIFLPALASHANFVGHGEKNFPSSFILSKDSDNEGNAILIETKKFKVIIPRDNQLVPGILKLLPKHNKLNDWDNWRKQDWEDLLRVQRLIEFTLIQAFEKRDANLKPSQDNKLINFFGKQRRKNEDLIVYFDIAPRYEHPITIMLDQQTIIFEDKLYGKPFDFNNRNKVSQKTYNKIVWILRDALRSTHFSNFELNDDFGKKWENCYSCLHPKNHPEHTGLIRVASEKSDLEFSMALDARSQEEKGRAFCDSDLHIPALRYWEDERMAIMGQLFKNYIKTINSIYPSPTGKREFDIAVLMNLSKSPEGTHTHGHFIPRTPGSIDYGNDFIMDANKYLPLTKDEMERKRIVSQITQKFIEQLNQNTKLRILWPM